MEKHKEKYTQITEQRPINVFMKKSTSGSKIELYTLPMTMKYETFCKLADNVPCKNQEDLARINRKRTNAGMEPVARCNVTGLHYDYEDGQCAFLADTMEDVQSWEKKYAGIVQI